MGSPEAAARPVAEMPVRAKEPSWRSAPGFALGVLFAINLLNFYDRQALGPLIEPIRKEFHLTDTQVGVLGTIFLVLYAFVGVPFGRIADSGSRKKLLATGMIVWSALTGASGFAASYS